jgi:hypothetical protein
MADTRVWDIGLMTIFISFPNTGGMAVSSHALTAAFHNPKNQDLGKGLGDRYNIFLIDFLRKVKG